MLFQQETWVSGQDPGHRGDLMARGISNGIWRPSFLGHWFELHFGRDWRLFSDIWCVEWGGDVSLIFSKCCPFTFQYFKETALDSKACLHGFKTLIYMCGCMSVCA